MRHADLDFLIVMERRRDELAEADAYRLLKAARAGRTVLPRTVRLSAMRDGLLLSLAGFLSLIGGRMLNWSCQLQGRYRVLAGSVAEQPASPCA